MLFQLLNEMLNILLCHHEYKINLYKAYTAYRIKVRRNNTPPRLCWSKIALAIFTGNS